MTSSLFDDPGEEEIPGSGTSALFDSSALFDASPSAPAAPSAPAISTAAPQPAPVPAEAPQALRPPLQPRNPVRSAPERNATTFGAPASLRPSPPSRPAQPHREPGQGMPFPLQQPPSQLLHSSQNRTGGAARPQRSPLPRGTIAGSAIATALLTLWAATSLVVGLIALVLGIWAARRALLRSRGRSAKEGYSSVVILLCSGILGLILHIALFTH